MHITQSLVYNRNCYYYYYYCHLFQDGNSRSNQIYIVQTVVNKYNCIKICMKYTTKNYFRTGNHKIVCDMFKNGR